jgi:hypothetical protein
MRISKNSMTNVQELQKDIKLIQPDAPSIQTKMVLLTLKTIVQLLPEQKKIKVVR